MIESGSSPSPNRVERLPDLRPRGLGCISTGALAAVVLVAVLLAAAIGWGVSAGGDRPTEGPSVSQALAPGAR